MSRLDLRTRNTTYPPSGTSSRGSSSGWTAVLLGYTVLVRYTVILALVTVVRVKVGRAGGPCLIKENGEMMFLLYDGETRKKGDIVVKYCGM